jgi:cleavage and polyadenylation specificity factor subunit 1
LHRYKQFQGTAKDAPFDKRKNASPLVTQWVFLARQNGNLEIYSLPDFSTKFLVRQFSLGPYVLTNSMTDTWTESKVLDVPVVKEILVVGLGTSRGGATGNNAAGSLKPMLFAFVGEDLFIYEAFPFFEGKSLDDPYIKVGLKTMCKIQFSFNLDNADLSYCR